MKKFILKSLALSIAVFITFTTLVISLCLFFPEVYSTSYQKGFTKQYEALKNAEPFKKKVIVIGGSYMTFSVDSQLLSELMDRPVYTLGIHSSMGMLYVYDIVKQSVKEGDLVLYPILPSDLNFYGMDLIWLSIENNSEMLTGLIKDQPMEVLKSSPDMVFKKINELTLANTVSFVRDLLNIPVVPSVYSAESFDSNGNLIYPRKDCIATEDVLSVKQKIFSTDMLDDNTVQNINALYYYCKEKGADLYLTYSPCYINAIADTDLEMKDLENKMSQFLKAPIISDIHSNLVNKDLIYDGIYHLNEKGSKYYTKKLYNDLKQYLQY